MFSDFGWQGGLGVLRLPLQYGDMLPQSAYEYLRTVTADLTVYLITTCFSTVLEGGALEIFM